MNYYVCLQILIFLNRRIFRHHEKLVLPYGQSWYARPYSWMQNLFLKFRFLNFLSRNHDLIHRRFLILSLNLLNYRLSLIFLNWNWKICRHRGKLLLPYGRFWYAQPYSWMQNLFLKFRFLNLKKIFLFLMSLILNQNRI